jgi:hypothetical protein
LLQCDPIYPAPPVIRIEPLFDIQPSPFIDVNSDLE